MPDASTYVAVSHVRVARAGASALEAAFRARLGEVDAWPGFRGLEVLADQRDAGHYLMVTRWRAKEDFVAYMRSSAHARSHARIPGAPHAPRPAGFEEYRLVTR
jgi:heme oxygenase (mycobilin-producing)